MTSLQTYPTKNSSSHFFFHKDRIEQEIAKSVSSFGNKTKLRDAVEYALMSGGKRLRPLIVYLVAEGLGHGLNVSDGALAVEFFHTASLIVDDLPCMDNDDERRNKPSVHKVYGEPIALLASYSLMTAGFERIHANAQAMREAGPPFSTYSDRACTLALGVTTYCSGILGATGGQFLDLFPPNNNLETVHEVIFKKTVTLFEVCFVLGWLFGGGEIHQLDLVKRTAYHLGMAFQIADDIGDMAQDDRNCSEINIASVIGKERALTLFEEEMFRFREKLKDLGLYTPSFEKMCGMLYKSVKDC